MFILWKKGGFDSFGLYLYGLVLKDKGNDNFVRVFLVEFVNSYLWNWNVWMVFRLLCIIVDILNSLNFSNYWMKDFFFVSVYEEFRLYKELLDKYEYF